MQSPSFTPPLPDETYADIGNPRIVSQTSQTLVAEFRPEAASELLADHFPGFPVVPGAVQLRWVFQLADILLGEAAPNWPSHQGYELRNLKFSAPMVADRVYQLRLQANLLKIEFSFALDGQRVSSGLIEFLAVNG